MPEVTPTSLEQELQSSFIDYAMSVIIDRAIPDARDGLKPVQRRILYAMYNLKNFHNLPTKKSARIVGECFVKDTLVLTNKGLIPIQDVQEGMAVYTQNDLQKVSKLYIMPKREILNVKLNNGVDVKATTSQKFKVLTKDWKYAWKEAKNLKAGDYVITKSFYPEMGKEVSLGGGKTLNENIAYLLGQFLSDGFVLHDNEHGKYHRIGFCSNDMHIINAITRCLQEEFDYTPHIEELHREYISANGQASISTVYQIRVSNSYISKFFISKFDLLGRKAKNRIMPKQIFKSPTKVIFALLSGMIDGDGYIGREVKASHIQYATISEEMANQIMILLSHLDIHGKKYKTVRDAKTYKILGKKVNSLQDSYSLEFDGINAYKLAKGISLKKESRRKRAGEILKQNLMQTQAGLIPWGSENIFTGLSKNHIGSGWHIDANKKKFRAGIKYPDGTKIRYSSSLRELPLHLSQIISWGIQNKLQRINSPLSPFIDSIIKDKIYFVEVIGIEKSAQETTYDIQVEGRHEFIANGILAHNCMGKYHPHGDMAIYDALARMAQDFSMHHLLVEGQGNFGSVDGDPPAASRYTEVRLRKIAEDMLDDLNNETVDFNPNFDNTEKEPAILPSKVPNLLINGATGIAVGVATSIPPHNLNEVCDAITYRIENKESTIDDILNIIKGPDFPTGGIAIMSQNATNGYRYGRGQLSIQAKANILEDKKRIEVIEIPYNVNKSTLMQTMAQLARDKKITGIRDIRDESDKHGIKIVIDYKDESDGNQILNMLYMHTQLQVTMPIINLAIIGKNLKSLNILQFVDTFIDHRREIILKRSKHLLNAAQDRLHIVDGLLIAIASIDQVITMIKASNEVSEARQKLMTTYTLSEKQANAILDMKLSRLTHLENNELETEKKELQGKVEYYTEVISKPEKVDGIIKEETKEVRKAYGKERKTQIIVSDEPTEIKMEDTISNEKVTIVLTNNGYVKRLGMLNYKEQSRGGKGIITINLKEGDYPKQMITCNNRDHVICLTNEGRAYWIKAYMVPESGRYSEGKAIVNLVATQSERIVGLLDIKDFTNSKIAFLTEHGTIKKTDATLFSHPRANGVRAITLDEGDQIFDTIVYTNEKNLIITTKDGKSIKFPEADIRSIGRTGMGVRGIRLHDGDKAKNILAANETGSVLTVTEKGYGKVTEVGMYREQGRGGGGVINLKVNEKTGPVAKTLFVTTHTKVVLINSLGVSITFPINEIRVTGRAASGVRLMRLEGNSKVVDAILVEE